MSTKPEKQPCNRWNWWSHAVLVGTERCMTCGFLKHEHLSERKRKAPAKVKSETPAERAQS